MFSFTFHHQMVITLSLVYNIQCFSGMIFQFVAEPLYRKKKSAMDVLAAGGRYDKLVSIIVLGHERKKYISGIRGMTL